MRGVCWPKKSGGRVLVKVMADVYKSNIEGSSGLARGNPPCSELVTCIQDFLLDELHARSTEDCLAEVSTYTIHQERSD